jgi:FKBP-type peptidyl-prolyl cis-trans isomerase (trigger factor)
MVAKPKSKTRSTNNAIVAKSDDGTIQVTYTIPFSKISKSKNEAALELSEGIEIPGFRKGKAPLTKILEHIPENTLLEKTLSKILPQLFADTIKEQKIKPAIYPKFELISSKDNEDWQIRATTAELPEVKLGKYKEKIRGALRSQGLWKPGDDKKKELSREEKEQRVIKALLENVKLNIPKVIIESEVNSRLSKLLEQIEKLGLSLDSYLASINKTSEQIRAEHERQAQEAVALDLILAKIAQEENVKISESEIDAAIGASSADPKLAKELDTPERRRLVESILLKRHALNELTSL